MPIKLIIARNLAELRKARNLTQGELAERFNYSDKSISKWEHGDTMPDIEVLKQLCDFYGVSLDYLVTEHDSIVAGEEKSPERVANKWTIVALSVSCVWLVAIVVFIALQLSMPADLWPKVAWISFIWAFPASFIVMQVFNGIWGRSSWVGFLGICITWTSLASIYVTFGLFMANNAGWQLWPIFLVGGPLTVAGILWNRILTKPKAKR